MISKKQLQINKIKSTERSFEEIPNIEKLDNHTRKFSMISMPGTESNNNRKSTAKTYNKTKEFNGNNSVPGGSGRELFSNKNYIPLEIDSPGKRDMSVTTQYNVQNIFDLIKNGGEEKMMMIDQILNDVGYGKYQIITIINTILVLMTLGSYLIIVPSLIIPFKIHFNVNDALLSLLSSSIFIGNVIGALLFVSFNSYFTRRFMNNSCLLIIIILTFFLGFIQNYISFFVFLVMIGICLAIILPININVLAENIPTKYRSFCLISTNSGVNLGQILTNIYIILMMPNKETDNIQYVCYFLMIIPFVTLVYSFFLFQDSPKKLIISGKENEGIVLLEKMHGEIKALSQKILIREVQMKNHEKSNNLSEIFGNNYLKISIILIILHIFIGICYFGSNAIMALTIKQLGLSVKFDSLIIKMTIIISSNIPGAIVGGIISEWKLFERKKTIIIGYFILAISCFLIIFNSENYTYYYFLGVFATPIYYIITQNYAIEVYSTAMRDKAMALLLFSSRLAAIGAQFLFIFLSNEYVFLPFYCILAISVVGIILVLLLPYDTIGKTLK